MVVESDRELDVALLRKAVVLVHCPPVEQVFVVAKHFVQVVPELERLDVFKLVFEQCVALVHGEDGPVAIRQV